MIVYAAVDANGSPYPVERGRAFTTHWLNGELAQFSHPPNALDLYSDADLARFGISKTYEPDAPAEGGAA